MSEGIPDDVLSVINRHIETVEHLEILLFLFEWEKAYSIAEINHRIQSSAGSVELRLKQLEAAGFVWKDGEDRFSFKRTDENLCNIVGQLADCYRTLRVRVIEAIYNRKTDAVQTFADAFKFKR